jgi:hypothetical protein
MHPDRHDTAGADTGTDLLEDYSASAARSGRRQGRGEHPARVLGRVEYRRLEAAVDVLARDPGYVATACGRTDSLVGHCRQHPLEELVLVVTTVGETAGACLLAEAHDDDPLGREDHHKLAEEPGEVVHVDRQLGELAVVVDRAVSDPRTHAGLGAVDPDHPAVAPVCVRRPDGGPDDPVGEQAAAPPDAVAAQQLAEAGVVVRRHVEVEEALGVALAVPPPAPGAELDPEG